MITAFAFFDFQDFDTENLYIYWGNAKLVHPICTV